jgi:hypothetical protein
MKSAVLAVFVTWASVVGVSEATAQPSGPRGPHSPVQRLALKCKQSLHFVKGLARPPMGRFMPGVTVQQASELCARRVAGGVDRELGVINSLQADLVRWEAQTSRCNQELLRCRQSLASDPLEWRLKSIAHAKQKGQQANYEKLVQQYKDARAKLEEKWKKAEEAVGLAEPPEGPPEGAGAHEDPNANRGEPAVCPPNAECTPTAK